MNANIGKFGEIFAQRYLLNKNYQLLKINHHCRYGEIDIIAKENQTLVFIEVKTRTGESFGQPHESITKTKLRKMLRTIHQFLENKVDINWRIDVIAVKLPQLQVIHYKNILNE